MSMQRVKCLPEPDFREDAACVSSTVRELEYPVHAGNAIKMRASV